MIVDRVEASAQVGAIFHAAERDSVLLTQVLADIPERHFEFKEPTLFGLKAHDPPSKRVRNHTRLQIVSESGSQAQIVFVRARRVKNAGETDLMVEDRSLDCEKCVVFLQGEMRVSLVDKFEESAFREIAMVRGEQ